MSQETLKSPDFGGPEGEKVLKELKTTEQLKAFLGNKENTDGLIKHAEKPENNKKLQGILKNPFENAINDIAKGDVNNLSDKDKTILDTYGTLFKGKERNKNDPERFERLVGEVKKSMGESNETGKLTKQEESNGAEGTKKEELKERADAESSKGANKKGQEKGTDRNGGQETQSDSGSGDTNQFTTLENTNDTSETVNTTGLSESDAASDAKPSFAGVKTSYDLDAQGSEQDAKSEIPELSEKDLEKTGDIGEGPIADSAVYSEDKKGIA